MYTSSVDGADRPQGQIKKLILSPQNNIVGSIWNESKNKQIIDNSNYQTSNQNSKPTDSNEKKILEPIKHLLPDTTYSPDTKDVGEKLINKYNKELPTNEYVSSSYLEFLSKRKNLSQAEKKGVEDAINYYNHNLRLKFLSEVATVDGNPLNEIKKYKTATCVELAKVSTDDLRKQGYPTYSLMYLEKNEASKTSFNHFFTVYSENKNMSLEKMMENLDNPEVKIVDLWTRETGQASEMIKKYNEKFATDENGVFDSSKHSIKLVTNKSDNFLTKTSTNSDITEEKEYFISKNP